jgi:hypothetical protein
MFENIIKFEAKVENEVGHFFIKNGVPIPVVEQMILQFLQIVAQIKAQQAQQAPAVETAPPAPVEAPPEPLAE